jgi:dTDP-4-dehydrorhamnose reductase
LNSLSANESFVAADDVFISPTYIPHLVTASLDLLIDKECGLWHLTNEGALSWKQFAIKIANKAGYDPGLIIGSSLRELNLKANRPKNSVLRSQKCSFLPSLDAGLNCFFNECITLPASVIKFQHKSTTS